MTSLPRVYPTVVHMLAERAGRAGPRSARLRRGPDNLRGVPASVAALAHELLALGAAGGRVALVMGNSIDICIAMFATHAARAQVVPLNPIYTAHELTPMIADAAPFVIIYDSAVAATIEPLAGSHAIPHLIRVGSDARRLIGAAWCPIPRAGLPDPLPEPDSSRHCSTPAARPGDPRAST